MSAAILENHLFINPDRSINIPNELKTIGVQFDHNIETVTFDCPRYWDNNDLSTMKIYINYMRPDGKIGSFIATNVVSRNSENEDYQDIINFDWTISRDVTEVVGNISFLVCAKKVDSNGRETHCWNSMLNKELKISDGLECIKTTLSTNTDIITQILVRMDSVEAIATPEAMQNYVNTYLNANPLELDSTLTSSSKAAPADKVGDISETINILKNILFMDSKIVDCQSDPRYFEEKLPFAKLMAITNEIKKGSLIKNVKFMGGFGNEDLDAQLNYIYYISTSGKVLYRKRIVDVYSPTTINYEAIENGIIYYGIHGGDDNTYNNLIDYPIMYGTNANNHVNDTVVKGRILKLTSNTPIGLGDVLDLSGAGGPTTTFFSIIIDGTVPKI